jgi:tRNA-2-methylthio-N6-dimethylallyladenosine synthase
MSHEPARGIPRDRRFFVETWGCQMNELDSQRMAGQLMQQGLLPTRDPAEAELILLNSCSVREKAEQKVYSRLGEYRRLKLERPGLRIGLCGCVAQQEGERALRRVRELDFVLGPARVGELAALLPRVRAGERLVATGFPREREYAMDRIARDGTHKGMVTVIEGCDKRCTFCIVPSTRGPERCRPLDEILSEVRHLLAYGFVEIELLGQTVNHWRDPAGTADFADLLEAVVELPGLERLRFVTSYPRDFTPRMIASLAAHPKIADYLHLPVQSGSDGVLRRMGRGYRLGEYEDLVHRIRAARPSVALSTDLIVGFPGETDEDFEATLGLVERLRFAALFAFRYSPRPGTAAIRLAAPVPQAVAEERLQRLLAAQEEIQSELNSALVGREMEALVTGPGRAPGTWSGRTSCHRIVHFAVEEQPIQIGARRSPPGVLEGVEVGKMKRVRIDRALPHSLIGTSVPA